MTAPADPLAGGPRAHSVTRLAAVMGCSVPHASRQVHAGRWPDPRRVGLAAAVEGARGAAAAQPAEASGASQGAPPAPHTADLTAARAAEARLRARRLELRLAIDSGEVVPLAEATAQAQAWGLAVRDAVLAFPARVSATVAAEVECDAARLLIALDRESRSLLAEISATPPPPFAQGDAPRSPDA